MSEDCYPIKKLQTMEYHFSSQDENSETNTSNEQKLKINKLLEYENMVSSAESKCGKLKGQLERIKELYTKKVETARPRLKTPLSGSFVEPTLLKPSYPKLKFAKMVRQNSQRIGTDTSGASLGTINNILAGITKSIQMPQLIHKVKSYESKPVTNPERSQEQMVHGVEEIEIFSKPKHATLKPKIKTKPSKSRMSSKASSTVFRRSKRPTVMKFPLKQSKSSDDSHNKPGIPTINRRSKRIAEKIRNRTLKPYPNNQDLVEIYHNNAVKECKSSESDVPKKNLAKENIRAASETDLIPPLDIDDESKTEQPKTAVSCVYNKNYTMPTISSRMKQVAKYYMNSFNIKTIPFCPATSTTASHNIGINIQQVISMAKNRQTFGQLSPTLAYNIALAAGKWENNPLGFMVTANTSRTLFSTCPLSKSTINYQHLQEVAKTIPEEIIEEREEENEDVKSPETQSVIITGPSGDVRVTNRKQTVWTSDNDDKRCTCIPQKGMEFQEIINKFNGNISKTKMKTPIFNKIKETRVSSGSVQKSTTEFTPLQNKERKLKDVLKKLHDEFERMTHEYDELLRKKENGTLDLESSQKLDSLDREMNSKEEEIVMVMALYKEVLALKQQVKALKDRSTSKDNVSVIKPVSPKFNGHTNFTTTSLLNKLLRQIQYFQTHYKRGKSRY